MKLTESLPKRKLIVSTVAVLIVGVLSAAFRFGGDFLVVNQTPVRSDVIIVLGGGHMERVVKGVELFQDGYAPLMLFSGGNLSINQYKESQVMAYQAQNMGVPAKHIILESNSTNTYQNALFTRKVLLARKLKSAIVVSSNYHMRRVQILFNRLYRGTNIRLTFCAAPEPFFNPDKWWSNDPSRHTVLSEYILIAAALLGFQD